MTTQGVVTRPACKHIQVLETTSPHGSNSMMYWLPLVICASFLLKPEAMSSSNPRQGYFLKFTRQPQDTIRASGDNVSLACTAESPTEHVTYTWLFNNTSLSSKSLHSGGNLTLTNVSRANEGEYRCIATNLYGSILSLKATLRIAYLRVLNSSSNTSISVRPTQSVKIAVPKVYSYPDVQFSWKHIKGNTHKAINDGTNGRMFVSLGGDLFIAGVDGTDDAGTYVVVVSNDKMHFNVNVEYYVEVSGSQPVGNRLSILQPPKHTVTTEGKQQVTLECIVSSMFVKNRPRPALINWEKNSSGLITHIKVGSNHKYGFGTTEGHKLNIFNLEPADEGWYTCVGGPGTKQSVTAPWVFLTVRKTPVLPSLSSTPPPRISVIAGTAVEIPCTASSGEVVWYRNASSITKQDFLSGMNVTKNGSLLIRNATLTDSALYQVFVRNEAGEISSPSVRLSVQQPETATTAEIKTTYSSNPTYSTQATIKTKPLNETATSEPGSPITAKIKTAYSSSPTYPTQTAIKTTASTSKPLNETASSDDSSSLWLYIVTSVGGGTAVLLIICITCLFVNRRKKRLRSQQTKLVEMNHMPRAKLSVKIRKLQDRENYNCGSRVDLLSHGHDYAICEPTMSMTNEIQHERNPTLTIDRPFGFARPERNASETDSSTKESYYLKLFASYEGNDQISKMEPIYTEAKDVHITTSPSYENKLALSSFNPTDNVGGDNANSRLRSRSVDDVLVCRSTHPSEASGQGNLRSNVDTSPVEPLYYILERPTDAETPQTNLYQSLQQLGGQREESLGGTDYAKLDIKSRSSSAPYSQGVLLNAKPQGKEQRSVTISDLLSGSDDRCPLHVNEGDVRFLSLDWRPSARQNVIDKKRSTSQSSTLPSPRFQMQTSGLHPNRKPSTSLECPSAQPRPSPERPNFQKGPSSLRSISTTSTSLERLNHEPSGLHQRTSSEPNLLDRQLFSQPSPSPHHRTLHEPTYIRVAVKGTKPRALRHRRNSSDSSFMTKSPSANRRLSGDNGRCPVELNESGKRVDHQEAPPVSNSWPTNPCQLNDDDTHCQVLVGDSASRTISMG